MFLRANNGIAIILLGDFLGPIPTHQQARARSNQVPRKSLRRYECRHIPHACLTAFCIAVGTHLSSSTCPTPAAGIDRIAPRRRCCNQHLLRQLLRLRSQRVAIQTMGLKQG